MVPLEPAAVDRYLERIGLEPAAVRAADRDVETLTRLQEAHVRRVPFENLSVVGDPFEDGPAEGVTLDPDALYGKVVERGRGGYCFELNGLFTALLSALDFDVHRAAGIILSADGGHSVPANHHVIVASLDREYLVDVGMGAPQMRRPTPLSGDPVPADAAGVEWRVRENDRPAYDRTAEYRTGDGWTARHVFDTTPRELSYFEAVCDYLSTAPESPFTGTVTLRLATGNGWLELDRETLVRVENGDRTERSLSPPEWYDVLEGEFGLTVPG
jgi:N-hydroxyarylamine O-acetyltransferase